MSELYLDWADAMSGDLEPGIARMRHHLSEFRATGSETMTGYFLAMIAAALGQLGQFEEGLRTIEQVFPFIERTNDRDEARAMVRLDEDHRWPASDSLPSPECG